MIRRLVAALCALALATTASAQPYRPGFGFSRPGFKFLGGGAVASAINTFDPADKGANVVLSNGNLTANNPSTTADSITRGTLGKSTGKWSFRLAATNVLNGGLANKNQANNEVLGNTANSVDVYSDGGVIVVRTNSANSVQSGTQPAGSPLDVIVDVDARRVWFKVNNVSYFNGGDPSAGTGGFVCPPGTVYPAVDIYNSTYTQTLDTSISRYAGFSAWGG